MPTKCPTFKQWRSPQRLERPNATERGYDWRWRRFRTMFLAEHPLCVECLAAGISTAADIVDHIQPHKGDMALFWKIGNHQSLCKRHHDAKTAKGQ